MKRVSSSFKPRDVEWHHICGDEEFLAREGYRLDYEYSILGYDLESGHLDMLMRFRGNGGHCERHRHVAATTTLILDGEQHLSEVKKDGSFLRVIREEGAYAIAPAAASPHMESGGERGCVLLLSLQASNGILFDLLDEDFHSISSVTIEQFVARWDARDKMLHA